MAEQFLIGYTWDNKSARYRSGKTGKYVARRDIVFLLQSQVNDIGELVTSTTVSYYEHEIDGSTWQVTMRDLLRRLYSQQSALGAGGWDRMEFLHWTRVGGSLLEAHMRLTNLAYDISAGKVSLAQILQRVAGHVNEARRLFLTADREAAMKSDRVFEERRRLSSSEHCDDCIELAARGWQPLGVLPIPGDGSTECGGYDKCLIERREAKRK